jgi:hypothetical protein
MPDDMRRWITMCETTSYTPPTLDVGDDVLVGKFKNRKAKISGFTKDDHHQPVLKTTKGDQKLFKPRIVKLDETPMWLQVYRGEYAGNKGGAYYTQSRDFARQFTQSGQDHEIKTRWIRSQDIYVPPKPVYAGDEDAWEATIIEAKKTGYKAVQFDESLDGREPPSIYVIDRSALRSIAPR